MIDLFLKSIREVSIAFTRNLYYSSLFLVLFLVTQILQIVCKL